MALGNKGTYKDFFNDDLIKGIKLLQKESQKLFDLYKQATIDLAKYTTTQKEATSTTTKLTAEEKRAIAEEKRAEQIKMSLVKTQRSLSLEYEKANQAKSAIKAALKEEIQLEKAASDSLRAKQIQLKKMQQNYELASQAAAKKMIPNIKKLDKEVKKLEADMGRHNRNVGNYASGYNGLQHSINQLSREAPAFANSMQTGFMAISNNIPMLFDELGKLKKQNIELAKSGKQTQSMFKSLAKSIFSFGTLLSVGVTLLTLYGKEVIEWVGNLISGKDALKELRKEAKEFNDEMLKSADSWKKEGFSEVFNYDQKDINKVKGLMGQIERIRDQVLGGSYWDETNSKWVQGQAKTYDELEENDKKLYDKLGTALAMHNLNLTKLKEEALEKEKKAKMKAAQELQILELEQERDLQLALSKARNEGDAMQINIAWKFNEKILKLKHDFGKLNKEQYKTQLADEYNAYSDFYSDLLKEAELTAINLEDVNKDIGESIELITKPTSVEHETKADDYLPDTFGFDDDDRASLKTAYDKTLEITQQYYDDQRELADKNLADAERDVDIKRDLLQAERDARDEGRKYNIKSAEEELNQSIKIQQKREEEQRKALRRQQTIETISQSTNMVSASAALIKDVGADKPYVYVPLLGLMWGTFIAQKTKAAQETKATYSTGGSFDIGGGTHADGKDTYFGTGKDGKRRYAEKGETLAIFTRKARQKYDLHNMIAQMNKGDLKLGENNNTNIINIDTSRMERGIDKLVDSNKKKTYIVGDKLIIEEGSTKKIINV